MTLFGRVAVAAASVRQETTLTLSSIDFDVSFVGIEAALEYRGLGAILSDKRERQIEDGSTHMTARNFEHSPMTVFLGYLI